MVYGTNAPWGLKPVGTITGAPWTASIQEFDIASAYATNIFQHDPVMVLVDGTIGIGTAGGNCLGVFMGVKYEDTDGVFQFKNRWTASTATRGSVAAKAMVVTDPFLIMSVQEAATNTGVGTGTAGTALAATDVFTNINFKAPTSGDTTTGISAYFLDNATEATTATLNFLILGRDPNPDNVAAGTSYCNYLVTWAQHQLKAGVAGVTT